MGGGEKGEILSQNSKSEASNPLQDVELWISVADPDPKGPPFHILWPYPDP